MHESPVNQPHPMTMRNRTPRTIYFGMEDKTPELDPKRVLDAEKGLIDGRSSRALNPKVKLVLVGGGILAAAILGGTAYRMATRSAAVDGNLRGSSVNMGSNSGAPSVIPVVHMEPALSLLDDDHPAPAVPEAPSAAAASETAKRFRGNKSTAAPIPASTTIAPVTSTTSKRSTTTTSTTTTTTIAAVVEEEKSVPTEDGAEELMNLSEEGDEAGAVREAEDEISNDDEGDDDDLAANEEADEATARVLKGEEIVATTLEMKNKRAPLPKPKSKEEKAADKVTKDAEKASKEAEKAAEKLAKDAEKEALKAKKDAEKARKSAEKEVKSAEEKAKKTLPQQVSDKAAAAEEARKARREKREKRKADQKKKLEEAGRRI